MKTSRKISPGAKAFDEGAKSCDSRAEVLTWASMALLVAVLAGRCFMAEVPFRLSMMRWNFSQEMGSSASACELARVTFSLLIWVCVGLWVTAGAIKRRLEVCHAWLFVVTALFAAAAGAGIFAAGDKRGGMLVVFEQVSLMASGFLAAQLCTDRRRRNVVVQVLVALAIAMVIKALWQVFVETPDRIADFAANKAQRLEALNYAPGSPQAIAFENRLKSPAPFGFMWLANPFASLMLVLACACLGSSADRLGDALSKLKTWKHSRGEIHMPTFAAVIAVAVAVLACVVLLLTRARGAILAAVVVALVGGVMWRIRKRLVARWKASVAVVIVVFVLGAAGIVGYGLRHDRLPTKTMTYRWFYWTGSASIIRQNPLLGVGGGNFGQEYLAHRRPQAEEAVKMPHNLFASNIAQFGLLGGLPYLLAVFGVVVLACRPARAETLLPERSERSSTRWMFAAGAGVLLSRLFFSEWDGKMPLLLFDVIVPLAVFACAMPLARWAVNDCTGSVTRFVLLCGLVAFVLHNMVEDSLSFGAPAMVFWVAAGACLATTATRFKLAPPRPASMVLVGMIVLGGFAFVWWPVFARTRHANEARRHFVAKRFDLAMIHAREAAQVDKLDSFAPADLATLMASVRGNDDSNLRRAYFWAQEAIARNGRIPSHHQSAFRIAAALGMRLGGDWIDKAIEHANEAIKRDPMNHRFRIELARSQLQAGMFDQARNNVLHARMVNEALLEMSRIYPPPSVELLNPDELAELEQIERRLNSPRERQ